MCGRGEGCESRTDGSSKSNAGRYRPTAAQPNTRAFPRPRNHDSVKPASNAIGSKSSRTVHPVGRTLIVVAPIVAIGVLYSLYSNWHWSEGELRAAVHEAADALNPKPRYTNRDAPQDDLVRAAVPETGAGPGPEVHVRGNGTAGYTITTEHTGAAFCMRLSLTPVGPAAPFPAALNVGAAGEPSATCTTTAIRQGRRSSSSRRSSPSAS